MTGLPVLIAFDGSPSAQRAVQETARLFPGAMTTVLTVWSSVRDVSHAARIALPDQLVEAAEQRLDEAAEAAALEIATEGADAARVAGLDAAPVAVACRDAVWKTIIEEAMDRGAAAIVVGSRGRSPAAAALLGSVSSGVVHHAELPVVVGPG